MISIAKALCIILVVVGHSGCPKLVHNFLTLFHVPLFFFTSGYFFRHAETINEFGNKLIKRIRRLYIPFWLYCVAFLLLNNLFVRIGFLNGSMVKNGINDYADGLFRLTFKMDSTSQLLGGFWFIRTLFIAAVINETVLFIGHKIKDFHYWMLALSVIGVLVLRSFPPGTPIVRQLLLASYGVVFFLYGKVYREFENRLKSSWGLLIGSFIFLLAWAILYPRPLSINATRITDSLLFMAIAPVGIVFVLNLSYYLDRCQLRKGLIYIGNHTLAVLALHLISFKLVSLIAIQAGSAMPSGLGDFPVIEGLQGYWWLLYSTAGVLIPITIVWLLHLRLLK